MLGLTLRKEFQGRRLKGTAIELANEKNTGATQVPAAMRVVRQRQTFGTPLLGH